MIAILVYILYICSADLKPKMKEAESLRKPQAETSRPFVQIEADEGQSQDKLC